LTRFRGSSEHLVNGLGMLRGHTGFCGATLELSMSSPTILP
jgi:hypothetical protein